VDERHRDIEFRIRTMAEQGVDLEVLSPSPANMMLYWTEVALCEELAEAENEAYGGLVRAHPEHFLAVGTVPLQDVPRAVRVLERANVRNRKAPRRGSRISPPGWP
jgi:aminocarboxymuconate-semialdehyde decarboxylase